MTESTPLVQFPIPSPFTLTMLGLGFVTLIVAAVSYEFYRRAQRSRMRRAGEWRTIHEILQERRLSDEAASTVERLLKAYAGEAPLRAITTRDGFERCVEAEMNAIRARNDDTAYEQAGLNLRDIRTDLGLDYVPIGHRIHSTRELHEGQWISLARVDDAKPQWVRVMVEDVNEAYFYVVLKDGTAAGAPHIKPGEEVRCRLWREEDARYLFDTSVAAFDSPPPTWRLGHTENLRRTQARAHFRVRHDQAVTVGVLNAPVNDDETAAKGPLVTRLRGRVTSLSAGGCALVFKQAVARQVRLRIPLELPEDETLEAEAQIIASSPISGGRYLVRVKFIGLDEENRDLIAKHIVQKQQQRLAEQETPE